MRGPLLGFEGRLGVGCLGRGPVRVPGSDRLPVLLGVPDFLALEDRSNIPSPSGFLPDEEEVTEEGSFPSGWVKESDLYTSSV